jgi:hypothetical protein
VSALLAKWWLKLVPVLAAIGAVAGVVLMVRKGGADAERVAQGRRESELKRRGDEVDNRVDAAGDAELGRLRDKWTRP